MSEKEEIYKQYLITTLINEVSKIQHNLLVSNSNENLYDSVYATSFIILINNAIKDNKNSFEFDKEYTKSYISDIRIKENNKINLKHLIGNLSDVISAYLKKITAINANWKQDIISGENLNKTYFYCKYIYVIIYILCKKQPSEPFLYSQCLQYATQ